MNKEEKELLNKLLCAMFPYRVICSVVHKKDGRLVEEDMKLSGMFEDGNFYFTDEMGSTYSDNYIPYLRPMSSMTEDEQKVFSDIESEFLETLVKKVQQIKDDNERRHLLQKAVAKRTYEMVQFYNKSHLDYNGLIEKGLALEAPKGMYERRYN